MFGKTIFKSLEVNESIIIKKTDLPKFLQKKTVFVGINI